MTGRLHFIEIEWMISRDGTIQPGLQKRCPAISKSWVLFTYTTNPTKDTLKNIIKFSYLKSTMEKLLC